MRNGNFFSGFKIGLFVLVPVSALLFCALTNVRAIGADLAAGASTQPADAFLGTWSAYWDNTFQTRFTITKGAGKQLAVLYEWEEVVGTPMPQLKFDVTPDGNVLEMEGDYNRQHVDIRLTPSKLRPDCLEAIGIFAAKRTAELVRGVTAPHANWVLGDHPSAATMPIMLDVKATIDGSDVLNITKEGATWNHKVGNEPIDVQVNGSLWKIGFDPVRKDMGLDDADLSTATVISRSGRDVIVMEKTDDGLKVYFDDSPYSLSPYEIQIGFERKSATPVAQKPQPADNAINFTIAGRIDGSDVLTITPQGAHWRHGFADWPFNVRVNGQPWDVETSPDLQDTGLANADFSTAAIVSRTGRDLMTMEKIDNGIVIYFADAPGGAIRYQIKLAFSPKKVAAH